MDFIKANGYGGAMNWAIDMDDFHGTCGPKDPLMTVLYNNMKNYKVPCESAAYPSKPKTWHKPWSSFPAALPAFECSGEQKVKPFPIVKPPTKPSTQKPATQKPITQNPITQKPVPQKPVTQEPITQKPKTTKICEGQSYLQHEKCNKYYWCIHGSPIEYTCPEGQHFDPVK